MRIPGAVLRTPVTITPAGASKGDGNVPGIPKTVRGAVTRRTTVVDDINGKTLIVWAVARIRPTVRVTDAKRPPAPGDTVTIHGRTRTLATVEPVTGPGLAVAYLELTAGDG